jgi:hypothetical protein
MLSEIPAAGYQFGWRGAGKVGVQSRYGLDDIAPITENMQENTA